MAFWNWVANDEADEIIVYLKTDAWSAERAARSLFLLQAARGQSETGVKFSTTLQVCFARGFYDDLNAMNFAPIGLPRRY